MTRLVRRSKIAALFLGVAPAIMLAAATPAEAWSLSVWANYRACTADVSERPTQRRIQRALEGCSKVIESERATRAQYLEALVRRGTLRMTRNDLSGASQDLQTAVSLNGDDPRSLLALGQVQRRLNNTDAALENLSTAFRNAGGNTQVAYEAQVTSADIYLAQENWDRARAAYATALGLADNETELDRARLGRGHAKFSGGDVDGAIDDYRAASERSIDALLSLAGAYRHQAAQSDPESRRFDAANRQYGVALSRAGVGRDSAEKRRQLARAYVGRGLLYFERFGRQNAREDLRVATENFNEAVERDPEYAPALVGRARALARTPDGERSAIADLNHALQLHPNDPDVLQLRGELHELSGNPERAMADYDQTMRNGGAESYDIYFRRGAVYLANGDFRRADQNFETAYELAEAGSLPAGADRRRAAAEALLMRSRAVLGLLDAPGDRAQEVAARAVGFADTARTILPEQSRYAANSCVTRTIAGGDWSTAQENCDRALALASTARQRSEAYGTQGLLRLRYALASARSRDAESATIAAAITSFDSAVNNAPATGDTEDRERTALYLYARGVAEQCIGRYGQANRSMRDALARDRSVAQRLEAYRIRPCNI